MSGRFAVGDATSDRITGVLLASACGDALGAGYAFAPPISPSEPITMRGQGSFAPGEWTDDSAQMIAIAMAAAGGFDLTSDAGGEQVALNLLDWYHSPARLKDIGIHSSLVFGRVASVVGPGLAARFRNTAAAKEAARPGSSGGNGALMRTAPVAMALWHRPEAMVSAAAEIGALTHADGRSSEACAVWCVAIRAAMLADDPSDLQALASAIDADLAALLPGDVSRYWQRVLRESFGTAPEDYYGYHPNNGYCVTTIRAAWAAITATPVPSTSPAGHLRRALERAVRGGGDTDTVACVAGGVLGAMWGESAIPLEWRRVIFGWPGVRDRDLVGLGAAIGGTPAGAWPLTDHQSYDGWDEAIAVAVHPFDDGVVLSGVAAAYGQVPIPGGPVGGVVSLCRVGRTDLDVLGVPARDRVEVRLIDQTGANPHLQLVIDEAAGAIAALRAEGKRVLVHCVAAQSRTPSVAARYAVQHLGVEPGDAMARICAALPLASPNAELAATVRGS